MITEAREECDLSLNIEKFLSFEKRLGKTSVPLQEYIVRMGVQKMLFTKLL